MAAKNVGGENSGGEKPGFVHLHVHSSYSLLEGALTIGAARRNSPKKTASRRWR